MNATIHKIARTAYYGYEALTNRKFYDLKQEAGGMLWPRTYKKIYELCRDLPDLDIIEVGGATGAGSIAIALGLKDANKESKSIVVEKCQGGTRSDVGGYQDNLNLIQSHFAKFQVQDQIVLYPHELTFTNGSEVLGLVQTSGISALIHDADGRIDRDFFLFWEYLQPGGLIIVDDYADHPKYKPIDERHPQGGIKSVMTYRLLNQLVKWGLFEKTCKIGNTIFGRKPVKADFSRFELGTCQEIIAQVQQERIAMLDRRGIPLQTV